MLFWVPVLIVIFILLFLYLAMPLLWKYAPGLLGGGNAAYKPSHLDHIAQPGPDQLQIAIPDVFTYEDGSYEIFFGVGRKFSNGTVQIYYKNHWYSAHPMSGEKKLLLQKIEKVTGSDALGTFMSSIMKWQLADTGISIQTKIIIYPGEPIIKFQIIFLEGLDQESPPKNNDLIFRFPCFTLEGPNQKVIAFKDAIFCPPTSHIPKNGIQGPVAFYDNELNVAIFGPMDHFLVTYTKKTDVVYHGFRNEIKKIPPSCDHSSLLLFTQGINKSIVEWCRLLHKHYNTSPKDPYADPVVANIGFWTDNGAYYYYRKEKGMNYASTIRYAATVFKERKIPFQYYQLDSWWYQKDMKALWKYPPFSWLGRLIGGSAYGGTILWEEIPTEFPEGLRALHQQIELPFACHARWFSIKSPYNEKYKSVLAKSASLPIDQQFWDDLMRQAAEKGIIMYEQDWLKNTISRISLLKEDVLAAEHWLRCMAEAAHKNNITIQYCMAPSGAFLYALTFPAVTNARVGGDYHARVTKQFFYPQFSQTNILAWAVGIWPSLDCYLTTKTPLSKGLYREKYPLQMTILSNLGGGLICPADKAELVNRELLLKTCTEEGLILKPDRPITANDLMFKIHQKPYIMDTWSERFGRFWRYILVVNLWPRRVQDTTLTLRELGYEENGILYDFNSKTLTEISPTDIIELPLKGLEFKYFIFAPLLKEGLALIGAVDKFVSCAKILIPKVEYIPNTLHITVKYSQNSSLRLLLYSREPPLNISLNNGRDRIHWAYDAPTKKLEFTLEFSENPSIDLTISFPNKF